MMGLYNQKDIRGRKHITTQIKYSTHITPPPSPPENDSGSDGSSSSSSSNSSTNSSGEDLGYLYGELE